MNPKTRKNDYYLEFGFNPQGEPYHPELITRVEDAQIPEGYALFQYREVYILTLIHQTTETTEYLQIYQGSGNNAHTRDVPIHYIANPDGKKRAIQKLQEWGPVKK